MSHSHGHSHRQGASPVALANGPLVVLLAFLALSAVATVVGVVALWPDSAKVDALRDKAQFSAPGVTFVESTVQSVARTCPDAPTSEPVVGTENAGPSCATVVVTVNEGPEKGQQATVGIPTAVADAGLTNGDKIRLVRLPDSAESVSRYSYDDVIRAQPLWILWIVFVLVVGAVARLRGILALISLGFAGYVLLSFMLPSLLSGSSGIAVSLVGSSAIMFVVLYLTHGPSARTSAALAGTLLGVLVTAVVGQLAINGATLSGFGDEGAAMLSAFAGSLSYQGIYACALIVAGLGVLNDVTITQASAVWELRDAGPQLTRKQLFTSGMRIGRDHIASTIYTIVFAYAGSALAVLMLLSLYDRPIFALLTSETLAEEIVRTLASGIGLVLAVPITTAIAVATVAGPVREKTSPAEQGA